MCWGKVERGLPCRCEDEARHALTALGAQTPPEEVVTDEMVEAVVKAIQPYTRDTLFLDEHKILVRVALKSAMETGRHD